MAESNAPQAPNPVVFFDIALGGEIPEEEKAHMLYPISFQPQQKHALT